MIDIRNLTKTYGHVTALDNLTLNIGSNKIVGLLGENGCGKTTLLRILAGLNQPTTGHVSIAGHKPGQTTKGIVSYLPDIPNLPHRAQVGYIMRYFADFFPDFQARRGCRCLRLRRHAVPGRVFRLHHGRILPRSRRRRLDRL